MLIFHVTKVLVDKTRKQNDKGILKEQDISVDVKQNGIEGERLKLRRVIFKTDEGKLYVFMTNNFTLPALQIAANNKNRWMIELLFI